MVRTSPPERRAPKPPTLEQLRLAVPDFLARADAYAAKAQLTRKTASLYLMNDSAALDRIRAGGGIQVHKLIAAEEKLAELRANPAPGSRLERSTHS